MYNESAEKLDPRTSRAKQKYEGKSFLTKEGNSKFIVKEFNSAANIVIEFPDYNNLQMIKSQYQLSQGIPDPAFDHIENGKTILKPLIFKDSYSEYINTFWWNNDGDLMTVIDYQGTSKVTVKFNDAFGYTVITTMQNIKKGQVLNPYHPNKFGGYLGEGPFISKGKDVYIYRRWYNILQRANDQEYYNKYHGIYKTDAYDNTISDQRWFNYHTFALWFTSELSGLNPNYEYDIDKDLLYRFYASNTNGKKCYGPDTCVLIPHDLNNKLQSSTLKTYNYSDSNSFDNYSAGKASEYIKKVAQEYYNDNAISNRVYNIIMNG